MARTDAEKETLKAREALIEEMDKPGEITGTTAVDRKGRKTDDDDKALKRDDAGAIAQQEAVPAERLAAYDDARRAQTTTWVEKGGKGSITVRSHRELDTKVDGEEVEYAEVDSAHASDMNLWLHGEGFGKGEVQYDIINLTSDTRVRFATWVDRDDGTFATQLTNILPGKFEVVAYHTRSDYESGDPLRRQVMEEVGRISLDVGA